MHAIHHARLEAEAGSGAGAGFVKMGEWEGHDTPFCGTHRFLLLLVFLYFPLLVLLRFFGKLESWKAALAGDGLLLHMVNQKTGQNLYHHHQKKKA